MYLNSHTEAEVCPDSVGGVYIGKSFRGQEPARYILRKGVLPHIKEQKHRHIHYSKILTLTYY